MYVLHVLILAAISFDVSTATVSELELIELQCLEICQVDQHRHCRQPPDLCGGCLRAFAPDNRGVCRPVSDNGRHHQELVNVIKTGPVDAQYVEVPSHNQGLNLDVIKKDASVNSQPQASDPYLSTPSNINSMNPEPYPPDSSNEAIFIAVILACSLAALAGILIAIVCYCKMQRMVKDTSEVGYPAYGATDAYSSAPRTTSNSRNLAQSAQMFHYQHQKQQMLELEKSTNGNFKVTSDPSSEENSDGEEFTVYECPGLATTGELEVRNPLYMEPSDGINVPVINNNPHHHEQ